MRHCRIYITEWLVMYTEVKGKDWNSDKHEHRLLTSLLTETQPSAKTVGS